MTTWFFDLDGTLADTDRDIREAWKDALGDLGLVAPDFDRDFVAGPPIDEMVKRLFPERYTPALAAELKTRFGEHYDASGFPNTREYPGVLDRVRELKRGGDRVMIVTNKRYAGAVRMCAHFGWDQIFEALFTGDMHADDPAIGRLDKPRLLAHILKTQALDFRSCVMVGDTALDAEAARANGVFSIGVAWGYGQNGELARFDRRVNDPSEI